MNAFVHAKRRVLSKRERAAFFLSQGGKCQQCTRPIGIAEDWDISYIQGEIDHTQALGNGGNNESANLRLLCEFCHDHKTGNDREMMAKGQRVAIKHLLPGRQRRRAWR